MPGEPDGGPSEAPARADAAGAPSGSSSGSTSRTLAERGALTEQAFAAGGLTSTAVSAAPVAIYTCDLEGKVVTWNQAAEALFGWTEEDVLGRPLPFMTKELAQLAMVGLVSLLEGARADDFEYAPLHRDGRQLHVRTSASLVRDSNGDPAGVLAFTTDLTARRAAIDALELAHHKWQTVLMSVAETVTILDEQAYVKEARTELDDILGHPIESWRGSHGFALLHPDDLERARETWAELIASPGGELREVLRARHADGHYESIEFSGVSLLHDPFVHGVVMTTRNVTEEIEAGELLLDETQVLELIARDAPLTDTLPAIAKLLEYHSGGSTCILLLGDESRPIEVGATGSVPPEVVEIVRRAARLADGRSQTYDLREPLVVADLAADARTRGVAPQLEALGIRATWTIPIIENRSDELLGVVSTSFADAREPTGREREVGRIATHLASVAIERNRWQQQLYHQANHHQLTGLPNRALILEHLDDAVDRANESGSNLAVMFVDLDRFKVVNDSLGHAAGDKLLVRFGGRLNTLVRPGDFVGHFGADEFIVVLEDVTDVDDVRFVANRLELALNEPFGLDEGEIYLSASIGVAMASGDTSAHALLQQADAALFRAKDLGRDRLEVFDRNMRTRAVEQLRIDRELRAAVEGEELELYYQPDVDLRTGRTVGVEALLRWNHPDDELLLPSAFLPVAEDTGIIVRIGRWVLDRALAQARAWTDEGLTGDGFTVGVNLSARELASPGLVDHVAAALERHAWPAAQLVLDLTEEVLMDDRDASLDVLTDLKDVGVRLALDDFGTGFSSLNYLHRFPVDVVKVDRTFVTNLGPTGEGSPVATAIMNMAHALGLAAAAEGVESDDQLAGLRALGCDRAQGFRFAHPRDATATTELLRLAPRW